ncbi:MAG: TonB-dependent receptor [Alistipes sp.]|nr:TonB-dependent receptor [Alistipes sp.]MBQ1957393.1 TonB-dependent receptor [Alistipes sp.]MBQ1979923.1 TonB-dependent receptor [Alistipes sp.]MBQ2415961.1 TonB-dependent receptor [Alistipes sp.]MBQ5914849.1 TonB-dependent receptor [Alistipes sp.]
MCIKNIYKLIFGLLVALMIALPEMSYSQSSGNVTVSGTITSADDGEPLIGVSVVSDSFQGVTSSIDGTYTIEVKGGSVLTFSYLGFKSVEYKVPSDNKTVTYNLSMESESESIDDVVVIAYGVRKKGTVAGSVSSVKTEKIEKTPTAAFDQALQGQVAGLSVLSNTGEPSASTVMTIRGTNSINSGTAPLYILDGVPISSSDFNTINPADIESLSVLKDASSTSIYGARAANGVIVITTKRGRMAERPRIEYRMQMGISQVASGKWDLMNTAERIAYEKEIGMTEGQNYNALSKIDVNWMEEVFNSSALLQSHEISVSGADEKSNYYISGGYYNQDGTAVGSMFERFSFRSNFDRKAASWLKVGSNTMLNFQNIKQADEGAYTLVTPISAARFMMPYWDPYRANGELASIADGSWKGNGQNPLEWLENNPVSYKKYKLLTTVYAEATPIEGLTLRSQLGVDYSHTTGFGVSYPSYAPNQGQGSASRSSTDSYTLTNTNTANYQFRLDEDHSFNFLLGHEGIVSHSEAFSLMTKGQNNDRLTNISTGTRATSWSDTTDSDYGFLSFFHRGEYNYSNKYFVEYAARLDGSSRFGADRRWAAFWSVGFMWDLRNEDFMDSASSWLTNAQISLSTGTSGNSSIPNYEHMALVGGGLDYVGNAGVGLAQPGNEDLGWEKPWTSNFAIHAGFWNRLNVDAEFYYKRTSDMLMQVPLPYSTSGYGFYWDNVGTMVNVGAELSLNASLISTEKFQWSVNANVSYNHNEITELYNGVTEYELSNTNTKLVVGHPLGEFYINRYAGVNPANGDALWYDKNGELTTELKDDDKVLIGKSYYAPWQGGFGTAVSWKGLSLSAQFSWVADRWMINNDRYFDESNGRFAPYNQSRRLLNRWKQPGDVTDIPRHGVYTEFDSRLLEDASFMRLKNLMLSYNLPSDVIKKSRVFSGLRIYAQAQNLFTFSKFSGLDPEGTSNIYAAQYPMSRQFTFGLDLTF